MSLLLSGSGRAADRLATIKYPTLLLATGDSITAGQTAIAGGYPDTLNRTYHDEYSNSDTSGLLTKENRATGGWFLSSVISDAAATDARIATNTGKDIYILSVAIGRNDGGATYSDAAYNGGASWIAQYRTYLTARRSAGWNKIVVCTITPYDTEDETARVNRELGNDRIRALVGSGHADACIDYGSSATSFMGNVSSHTGDRYYVDYVHPSVEGHAKLGEIAAPVYDSLQVKSGFANTPVVVPVGGSFGTTQSVTMRCSTVDAEIYYTIDGSTPDNTKTRYTGPVSVASTTTIKAIAIKSGLTNSSVNTQAYAILSGMYWNQPDVAANVTLSGDRKTITPVNAAHARFIRINSVLPSTGKFIVEVACTGFSGTPPALYGSLGICETTLALTVDCNSSIASYAKEYVFGSNVVGGAAAIGIATGIWATDTTFPNNARTMFAIDMTNGKMWHSISGGASWNAGGFSDCNPVTGVRPHWTFTPSANWYFAGGLYQGLSTTPAWVIPSAITGTIPSGYTGLNA